MIAIP